MQNTKLKKPLQKEENIMALLIVKTDEYANTDAPELLINYILNMEKSIKKYIWGIRNIL